MRFTWSTRETVNVISVAIFPPAIDLHRIGKGDSRKGKGRQNEKVKRGKG